MGKPTMRQLRKWHRKMTAAHTHVCEVAEEAEEVLGYDAAVVVMDPGVELHAALGVIEGMIRERLAQGGRGDGR